MSKQAQSKIEKEAIITALLSQVDDLRDELNQYRAVNQASIEKALDIEYTYDSNRIEGNTLTLRETDIVIHKGLTVGGKPLVEHLEAINHYEAVELIRDLAQKKIDFNRHYLLSLHALILQGIDKKYAGCFRDIPVMISGSRHIPPQPFQVGQLMDDYFTYYQENEKCLHPVILAAEMHERLVTIHPFVDGNGRTARLVMNLILLQRGYPIAIIHGDSESRLQYYDALEQCNLNQDKQGFYEFIAHHILQSLSRRLSLIKQGD
jgi:Fic family protein